MNSDYDTYCGLYCGACDALLATERGTVEALAKEWRRPASAVACRGCKTNVNSVFCRECKVKTCATAHAVETCIDCGDYPCQRLIAFRDQHPHHGAALRNLERRREVGKEAWLDEQRARWSCLGCGRAFSWYEERCQACGEELDSCVDEEREKGQAQ